MRAPNPPQRSAGGERLIRQVHQRQFHRQAALASGFLNVRQDAPGHGRCDFARRAIAVQHQPDQHPRTILAPYRQAGAAKQIEHRRGIEAHGKPRLGSVGVRVVSRSRLHGTRHEPVLDVVAIRVGNRISHCGNVRQRLEPRHAHQQLPQRPSRRPARIDLPRRRLGHRHIDVIEPFHYISPSRRRPQPHGDGQTPKRRRQCEFHGRWPSADGAEPADDSWGNVAASRVARRRTSMKSR